MTGKSTYTDKIGDEICLLVSEGSNLHRIGHMKDYPCRDTIHKWLNDHKTFSDNYVRARKERGDWRANEMDNTVQELKDGKIDHNVARIALDNHKWQAGKENPKRYGDKTQLTGADGQGPVEVIASPANKLRDVLNAQSKRIGGTGDTSE